jgi:hypothetical protein
MMHLKRKCVTTGYTWHSGRVVVGAILAVVASARAASAQHVRTLESSRQLRDSAPVTVRLQLGTGTLNVAGSDAPLLYRSISRFGDAYTAPRSSWSATQRSLLLEAGQRTGAPSSSDENTSDATTQDWRVQLTRKAPLDLTITASAADATLDLSGIPLRRFSLNTGAAAATVRFDALNPEMMSLFDARIGAGGLTLIGLGNAGASDARIDGEIGDISLDLGGRWQRDLQLAVSTPLGSVKLVAPPNIGLEVQVTGLLKRATVTGQFTREGNVWRSRNFNETNVKVRVLVKSLMGKIEVVQR